MEFKQLAAVGIMSAAFLIVIMYFTMYEEPTCRTEGWVTGPNMTWVPGRTCYYPKLDAIIVGFVAIVLIWGIYSKYFTGKG